MFSRSAAPVPSKSRAPVSQSRSAAGAGAAISAGNLMRHVVTTLPVFSRVPQTVVTHSAPRRPGGQAVRTALTAGWQAGTDGRGMGGWDGRCRGREGGCLVTLVHSGLLKNGRATEW